MKRSLLLILVLSLSLGGCTDPEKVARARAIEQSSSAQYQATTTAVALEARATATAVADREQVRAATQAERIERQESLIWWSTIGGVVFVLVLALALSVAAMGGAVALVKGATLRAKLIWMDKDTKTLPVLIQGRWFLDLETGERNLIQTSSQPHLGRLVGSTQVRVTGLLADAAGKVAKFTKDPKPGDMLPAIGSSVPLLEGDWLAEVERRTDDTGRDLEST